MKARHCGTGRRGCVQLKERQYLPRGRASSAEQGNEEDAVPFGSDRREQDVRLLSRILSSLLQSAHAGMPVDAVLPKYADRLTTDDYASLLVGLSRKAHWRTADEVVGWLRTNTNVPLPWDVFVLTARERIKLGYMDAAVQALDWIRRHGFALSGSALEVVAELKLAHDNNEIEIEDMQSLDALVGWAQTTNAGKALWSTFTSEEYQARVGIVQENGKIDYKEHEPDVFEAAEDAGFNPEDVRAGQQKVIVGSTGREYSPIDKAVSESSKASVRSSE